MAVLHEGGCQCGALRYRVDGDPVAVAVCHCSECQRQSGSAFGMSLIARSDAFRWLSGEPRLFTTRADSGATRECFFCESCGVRIYNALDSLPGLINLKPGTLDDRSWLAPSMHVWLDSKQPWTPVPEGVRCFERNPG
jgi:hypothetical protein